MIILYAVNGKPKVCPAIPVSSKKKKYYVLINGHISTKKGKEYDVIDSSQIKDYQKDYWEQLTNDGVIRMCEQEKERLLQIPINAIETLRERHPLRTKNDAWYNKKLSIYEGDIAKADRDLENSNRIAKTYLQKAQNWEDQINDGRLFYLINEMNLATKYQDPYPMGSVNTLKCIIPPCASPSHGHLIPEETIQIGLNTGTLTDQQFVLLSLRKRGYL